MDLSKVAVHLLKNYPRKFRNAIYSLCGFKMNDADIRRNVMVTHPKSLHLGKNVLINHNCSFILAGCNDHITLGDNVWIGPNCLFTTLSHDYGDPKQRAGKKLYLNISIGSGTWIGCSSTILPNVVIGQGVVVAAGSVVTKSIPDNQLWGGVPARFIKQL